MIRREYHAFDLGKAGQPMERQQMINSGLGLCTPGPEMIRDDSEANNVRAFSKGLQKRFEQEYEDLKARSKMINTGG